MCVLMVSFRTRLHIDIDFGASRWRIGEVKRHSIEWAAVTYKLNVL
jgi:hypothetical protein